MTAHRTPRTASNTPVRVVPEALLRDVRTPGFWDRNSAAPIIGAHSVVDGVGVHEVSFVIPAPSGEAIVHINSLTDRHREDITAARFERISDEVAHVSYLIADDLVASYRIAQDSEIAADIGRDRAGWLRIHALGQPDPLCRERLPNPLGSVSSVLRMPRSRQDPAWRASRSSVPPQSWPTRRIDHGADGEPGMWLLAGAPAPSRLLVLFDGEQWRACGIGSALAARDERELAVVLVDSGSLQRRAQLLPHPDRVARHLAEDVLPSARAATGAALPPEAVVVAGQSYGGLAAASIAVLHPELAASAVAQSGSFHFRAADAARRPGAEPGDLIGLLAAAPRTGRVHVQAGTEEDELLAQSETFVEAARASGMHVSAEEWSGGHDYAWWTDGLFAGLDALHR